MAKFPRKFYKYYPVDDSWLSKLFSGESMLFSSRKTFNDPFDSRPLYHVPESDETLRWIAKRLLIQRPDLTKNEFLAALSQISKATSQASAFEESGITEFLDDIGILSLTTSWGNALMWAHYASHHKGICVAFRSGGDVFATASKVKYSSTVPVIVRPTDSSTEMQQKAFFVKAKCWSYEEEWRAIKMRIPAAEMASMVSADNDLLNSPASLKEQDGPRAYRFDQSSIESITLGMRIPDEDERLVLRCTRETGLKIPIYKVRKPAVVYKLARDVIADYR